METFTDPDMPNPSAVALSAVNGASVFYATTDGVEHAFRFEIGTPVAQQTPLEAAPGVSVPLLTPGNALATEAAGEALISPETLINPDLLFLPRTELLSAEASNGAEPAGLFQQASTLGSFDLLAFAEGGKGESSDLGQRLAQGWQDAQNTWGTSLQQSAAESWSLESGVVRETGDAAGALLDRRSISPASTICKPQTCNGAGSASRCGRSVTALSRRPGPALRWLRCATVSSSPFRKC